MVIQTPYQFLRVEALLPTATRIDTKPRPPCALARPIVSVCDSRLASKNHETVTAEEANSEITMQGVECGTRKAEDFLQ